MVGFAVGVVVFVVEVVGFAVGVVVFAVEVVGFAVGGFCLQDRSMCRLQFEADEKKPPQKVHLLRSIVGDACLRLTCRFKLASMSVW